MAATKAPRTMKQDDVIKTRYVCDATLSPDGKLVAYVLSEVTGTGEEERQQTAIYLVPVKGGKPRRLTQGKGNDSNPAFTADGQAIVFLSTRDKLPQIYRISISGGEAVPLTSMKQGAGPFEMSPDRKRIAFAATKASTPSRGKDDHVVVDRAWYRFDPMPGYLGDVQQAAFILPLDTKASEPTPVTDFAGIVSSIAWSPDGKRLAVVRTGLPHQTFVQSDLEIVSPGKKQKSRRIVEARILSEATFSPDGKRVTYLASNAGLAGQTQLMSIDTRGGKETCHTRRLDRVVGVALQVHGPARIRSRFVTTEDGNGCYFPVTDGGTAHLYRLGLTGREKTTALTTGQRVCHLLAGNTKHLLFTSQDPNHPPELFALDIESGEERALTHHNDKWLARMRLPEVEHVIVNTDKGITVEGWVLVPKQVRRPCKTILVIHGGPHSGYGNSFNFDFQELVGEGYAVAYANPRGSTGYGDKFSTAIVGCWGDPELKDFNTFLDRLVSLGISDPDRLGVTGISGGGHLTGWLVGHTKRFKAAVAEQGVYNMLSMWGTSDAGKALIELEMGGAIHKIPEVYWARSPLAHAHKCKTPTLLIQGENDIRCPMEQAEQMYAALLDAGCTTGLVRLQGCSHGTQISGRPALRRYRMNVQKDWFARYLK